MLEAAPSCRPGILLAAALASALPGPSSARAATAPQESESLLERVDSFLLPYVESGNFSGVLLVADGQEVLLEKAFGEADHEDGVPMRRDHRLCIGSVSKTFTAAAVLTLVERGEIDLDSPVDRYVPSFPHGRRITVRHLLEHRSGLPNLYFKPSYAELAVRSYEGPAEVVELVRADELVSEPGNRYAYNNLNYVALALLVERVSDTPYPEFLKQEILSPLEIHRVGLLRSPEDRQPDLARGYDPVGRRAKQPERYADRSILVGAGSACATARALWKWFDAVSSRKVLGSLPDSIVFEYVGRSEIVHGHPAIVASGWDGIGYSAEVIYLRDKRLATVALSNLNIAQVAGEIAEGVTAVVLGDRPAREAPAVRHLPQDSLVAFAGRYRFGSDFYVPGGTLEVVERDGALIDESREPAAAMIPLVGGGFLYRPVWATIAFERDPDGRITGLTFDEKFKAVKERP